MFTSLSHLIDNIIIFLLAAIFFLILVIIGGYVFLHCLYSKGIIKSSKLAPSLDDICRHQLLALCRESYLKMQSTQASKEGLETMFRTHTECRLFPRDIRIEVESMLDIEYFYQPFFNLADFRISDSMKMYEDFVQGKYKQKDLYSRENILKEKLPEGLKDDKTIKDLLLLVDNGWLDSHGQPKTKPTPNNPKGRHLQEIVLACYHIHPYNYSVLYGELWNKSPETIKSSKSNALSSKNQALYYKEISNVLGRDVLREE